LIFLTSSSSDFLLLDELDETLLLRGRVWSFDRGEGDWRPTKLTVLPRGRRKADGIIAMLGDEGSIGEVIGDIQGSADVWGVKGVRGLMTCVSGMHGRAGSSGKLGAIIQGTLLTAIDPGADAGLGGKFDVIGREAPFRTSCSGTKRLKWPISAVGVAGHGSDCNTSLEP
jgi:hypothetical protein